MQKLVDSLSVRFLVVVIAVVVVLIAGLVSFWAADPVAPIGSVATDALVPLSQPHVAMTGDSNTAATQREAVPSQTWQRLSGRCMDWETQRPIRGCQIRAGDHTVVSDADGAFAIALPIAIDSVTLAVEAADRVGVSRNLKMTARNLELGDVALRRAGRVSGMLADDRGQPCRNRLVALMPGQHIARQDGFREQLVWQVRTEVDGSFALPLPLPAGALRVHAPELPTLLGDGNHVLRCGEQLHLSLRCRSWRVSDELTGIVCDAAGQPVSDAVVQALVEPRDDAPVLLATRTDHAGAFFLLRGSATPAAVCLRVLATGGHLEPAVSGPHAFGGAGLRIELPAAAGIWLQVVDAETGAAIEQFAVQHVALTKVRDAAAGSRKHDGHHEHGRCWLDGVAAGDHEVIVWPTDPGWLPCLPHAFHVDGRVREVRVALARASDLPVTVLSAAGKPVPGVSVQLVLPASNGVVRDLSQLLLHGGLRVRPNVRLAAAQTDSLGVARLRWQAGGKDLQLRLHGGGIAPQLEVGARLDPAGMTVQVAAAGALHAVLQGAAGMRLQLSRTDGEQQLPLAWSEPLQLDEQGTLRAAVPAGSWQVRLVTPLPSGLWHIVPEVLANVEVQADAVTELRQSVAHLVQLGELSGSAFVDGVPASRVVLVRGGTDGSGGVRGVDIVVQATDDRGVSFR